MPFIYPTINVVSFCILPFANVNSFKKGENWREILHNSWSCTEIIATIVHYKAEIYTIVYEIWSWKSKWQSDISLTIMLDIHIAFSAHHLSVDEHPFKHILFWKRVSGFKGLANTDLHVLWNYARWTPMQVGSYLEAMHAKGVSC